jgi:hypothetical protein
MTSRAALRNVNRYALGMIDRQTNRTKFKIYFTESADTHHAKYARALIRELRDTSHYTSGITRERINVILKKINNTENHEITFRLRYNDIIPESLPIQKLF